MTLEWSLRFQKTLFGVRVSVRYVMFAPIYVLGVVFSQCVLHQVGL